MIMPTRQVNVQRWTINSRKPFAVAAALEAAIGRPNMSEFAAKTAAAATFEEIQSAAIERRPGRV
jgi:hypothetical protein